MNWKTTLLLFVIAGGGAGGWYWLESRRPAETAGTTTTFLEKAFDPAKLTRIEVTRGKETRVVLERVGGDWYLPGKWPARPQETEQWLAVLTGLRSRFAPNTIDAGADLKPFGLDKEPFTIKLTAGDETHALRFGEEPGEVNRFSRPTFVRLDDKPEVIRLGPGVVAALDRPAEYFRQRRLFPFERVLKDEDTKDKVEQLTANTVEVVTKEAKFTLGKKNDEWILVSAHKKSEPKDKKDDWQRVSREDRLDPARRDSLLRAFPDVWADKFVEGKTLDETGLGQPEYVFTVAKAGGNPIKLLVGKVSHTEKKTVPKQMGPQVIPIDVSEEYRYAKLDKNDQVFEIKADKLRDLAPPVEDLRDPLLARFNRRDVRRVEIRYGDQTLVFARAKEKDEEKWRLEKPVMQDVDASAVDEFIDKLGSLRAGERDILEDADPKSVGLTPPAGHIKITVEETDKNAPKPADAKDSKKITRDIVLRLGVKEKDKDKVFVRVDSWPRINQLDGDFLKLVDRSELAYRPRELWKLDRDDIKKITVHAEGQSPYEAERGDKGWRIAGLPESTPAGDAMEDLADDLVRLRVERFESKDLKDLKKFGLDKPAFKLSFAGKDGKPRTLEIGGKAEGKDAGRFARIEGGDAVFVLNEKFTSRLRPNVFDFLDKTLLSLAPLSIERIRFEGTAAFNLELKGDRWQVVKSPAGDFAADPDTVKLTLMPFSPLRADKYVEFGPKIDFAKYGLAPPAVTITIKGRAAEKDKEKDKDKDKPFQFEKDGDKEKDKKAAEYVIDIGKEAPGGGRYARIDKKDAVVVLDVLTSEQLTRTHLDFVDARVLRFDGDAVMRIERKMPGADFELERRDDTWQILKPSLRDADNLTIFDLLRKASNLRAVKVAEYPAKDLAKFGLEKPAAIVTIHVELDGNAMKHVVKLGDLVKDSSKKDTAERYAMVEGQKMVVVLPADISKHLAAPALYFADRNLVSFSSVDKIEMTRGKRNAVFSRADKGWEMTQPTAAAAETNALDDLVRSVQRLRADEIVAEKAPDLKKYGLDQPAAQWRFKSGSDEKLNLLIGAPENEKPEARRYAKIGDKNVIFLVSGKLAAKALAEFRARDPLPAFEFGKAMSLTLTQGSEKSFTLEKKEKTWQLAGDPKKEAKAEVVFDVLVTLSSLRASHFVADAKADLKQYGLAPPAWKIEVQLPVGKRELWLGGFEEKSKRFYATIPGTDAVFVIDEGDGTNLARPMSAFFEMEKKK